jgi:glycosyltransferase involved in cell wall biosynthesis
MIAAAEADAPNVRVGVVVIGRNEGERLRACLSSIDPRRRPTVYVDSGSSDGSLALAESLGADVVALDMSQPFTAARARNEGFAALQRFHRCDFVQFVDGDTELVHGWLPHATRFLFDRESVAVVCGRRRERHPERTIFNALCDMEWDTPVGEALECGGDALVRSAAFAQAGGFAPELIAGEEPDLCVRLRARGWTIWRVDHDMTLHDAAMVRLGQWWLRCKRAGYAFAEVSRKHRGSEYGIWRGAVLRAALWGGLLPMTIGVGAVAHPVALAMLGCYPAQIVRLAMRRGPSRQEAWIYATFGTLCKFPEAAGIAAYYLALVSGRRRKIIEYK